MSEKQTRKRRRHSAEFKVRVALEAIRELQTVNEFASCSGGVSHTQVSAWKNQVLDVEEANGRSRLVAALYVASNPRLGLFVANNPVIYVDRLGLFNPAKGLSALGNAANAGRLYASGALKLTGAAGLTATGAGARVGAGAAALGGWNMWSGQSAWNRSLQQWNEAWNEDWSDASWKNLLGVLPFGTEFDDPCEPSPWEVLKDKAKSFKDKPLKFIQEIETFGFLCQLLPLSQSA